MNIPSATPSLPSSDAFWRHTSWRIRANSLMRHCNSKYVVLGSPRSANRATATWPSGARIGSAPPPYTLPAELAHILDERRACQRGPHPRERGVHNAVSDRLAWKPQPGACRLSPPGSPAGSGSRPAPAAALHVQCVSRHSIARTRSSTASTAAKSADVM